MRSRYREFVTRRRTRDRFPFIDVDDERAASPLREDVALVSECLEPDLDGAFREAYVLCYCSDPPVHGSSAPIRVDHKIQEEPDGPPHSVVMLGAAGDHEASPDETPPVALLGPRYEICLEDGFDVLGHFFVVNDLLQQHSRVQRTMVGTISPHWRAYLSTGEEGFFNSF